MAARAPSRWRKLGWFVLLWAAGVAGVGAVAYGLKLVFNAAFGV